MPKRLFSIGEVSRLSNVAAHRIHYAIRKGLIKNFAQVNGRRCFTPGDVARIREHFDIRVLSEKNHDVGVFTR